ncbi:hypothetical protein CHARACLAT_012270 [Characodon lateralis]|uniref:Uncharacterized protein n=1 Tax=Characodon lateralis TaxID=208331 RepID=A0ABU7F3F8_9TELE|nr:hypothetical protein [Characodon lateralis]
MSYKIKIKPGAKSYKMLINHRVGLQASFKLTQSGWVHEAFTWKIENLPNLPNVPCMCLCAGPVFVTSVQGSYLYKVCQISSVFTPSTPLHVNHVTVRRKLTHIGYEQLKGTSCLNPQFLTQNMVFQVLGFQSIALVL